MRKKSKSPSGRELGLEKRNADGRDQQLQYTHLTRFQQYQENPEAYHRAVRRMMADLYVMAQDFPARLRYSWVVDRNGRLRPLSERRAAG